MNSSSNLGNSGSDFAQSYFTEEENQKWIKLLTQLRAFESAVCHTIRSLEKRMETKESEIRPFSPTLLDAKIDGVKHQLELVRGTLKDDILDLQVDADLRQELVDKLKMDISDIQLKIMEVSEIPNLAGKCFSLEADLIAYSQKVDELASAMILLEEKNLDHEKRISKFENGSSSGGYIWNGHENIDNDIDKMFPPNPCNPDGDKCHDENPNLGDNNNGNNNNMEIGAENGIDENSDFENHYLERIEPPECEIMVGDPFLSTGSQIQPYDGNPSISFTRWAQKFKDILSLFTTALTEQQKISRLKFCLAGPARAELDSIEPHTLEGAIAHLKQKFENDNTKSIARQSLSICRQAPGEKIFEFANRLNEAVRTALAGEDENAIRKRLLEEFMDRLLPDLQYEVKAQRPNEYAKAYELAQHYELLANIKRPSYANAQVAELSEKVEALAIQKGQNSNNARRKCYYCGRYGHLIRDCRAKKRDESGRQSRWQNNGQRNGGNRPYHPQNGGRYEARQLPYHSQLYYGDRNRRNNSPYRQNNNYYGNNGRRFESNNTENGHGGYRERRESSGDRNRPPTPKVRFNERSSASVRVASPLLLAVVAILSIFGLIGGAQASSPMICLPDAPVSLWRLPEDPICPTWKPIEIPIPVELTIYRANTLQYKTAAISCQCINTIIHRRRSVLGKYLEETETQNVPVPTSTCRRMNELNHSPAGDMISINGTFRATNNSLEVGWTMWPFGIVWSTSTVSNCYLYETVVFTRYNLEGINTPIGACPGCQYQSGACRCPDYSLVWVPEKTQQCAFIHVAHWKGEFSTNIWMANSNDFALTFANDTVVKDCGGKEFQIADQGFAVPKSEFEDLKIKAAKEMIREKRESMGIMDNTKASGNTVVGIVYSSQLSAQLTALSSRVTQTVQHLFTDSVQKICTSLESLSNQMYTLANANPTLLARHFLSNSLIEAKLITEKTLEIKPCLGVNRQELHFNWKKGICFDKLPVTFMLYNSVKHGFMDPITSIIHAEAREVDCHIGRYLYVPNGKKTTQYDQITGDLKEIPAEAVHQLMRYGKIDFPDFAPTIFRNKVMANLTELFSPEHFAETLEIAEITQEIARLTRPNAPWSAATQKGEIAAGNIVSNGLFSFLKGGVITANQIWVFLCCVYVSASAAGTFVLPPVIAELVKYLSLGTSLQKFVKQYRKRRAEKKQMERNLAQLEVPTVEIVPLNQRWPTPAPTVENNRIPSSSLAIQSSRTRRNFGTDSPRKSIQMQVHPNQIVACLDMDLPKYDPIATLSTHACDEDLRIRGSVNGFPIIFLIDTGAHVSICGTPVANGLSLGRLNSPLIQGIYGLGKNFIPAIGQTTVELEISGHAISVDLLIVDREIGSQGVYDIIVGRNALKKMPFLLDLETGELLPKATLQRVMACEKVKPQENDGINFEKWVGNSDLNNKEEMKSLRKCLEEYKIFSKNSFDLGTCSISAPTIITSTEIPPKVKPYPLPEKYKPELKAQIDKMLKVGVIKESTTPWVHNIVPVTKSNGELRPCVNFRPLNAITIADPYPLPRMDTIINKVSGKAWYSTLDLSSGFWQIPLDEQSSFKCGVITEWGLYQMLKLPFGLKNAPSVFQRVMDIILKEIPNVNVFIDDIIVHTHTVSDHIASLKSVFERLHKFGLKLKGEKCTFMKNKAIFIGHEVSKEGFKPSHNNQEVIEKFPEPKNVNEVRRFLGKMNFFRNFIENFATIAIPLTRLTRDNVEFTWAEKERDAFNKLKAHLLKAPCLKPPNYKLPFHLFTDASSVAYAGVLMQEESEKGLHAIAYWSRTLNPVESKLPATHGELAAIVHAINAFRAIIYGSSLTIYTDHRPLTFLFSKASSNAKLNRWLLSIQDFDPKVVYLEGKANRVADALSRVPIEWRNLTNTLPKDEIPYLLTLETAGINRELIEKEIKKDKTLQKVMEHIKNNWREVPTEPNVSPFYHIRDELILKSNVLFKNHQIIIPDNLIGPVLTLIHRAHFGIVRSKARARQFCWWPKMNQDIETFILECSICQRNGPSPRTDPGNKHKWPEAKLPFERVHMDLAGPMYSTNFLIVVDAYSNFPFVIETKSTNSTSIISILSEIFSVFGSPITIVSDNGPQFTSYQFKQFLEEIGTKHILTAPYHPSSNGLAEKFVQTFKRSLTKLMAEGKNMNASRLIFLQEYRASPDKSHESPARKFLKREIQTPINLLKFPPSKIIQTELFMGSELEEEPNKEIGNKRIGRPDGPYQIDDPVWVKMGLEKGKFAPGIIKAALGERMYLIKVDDEEKRFHIDQIKQRRTTRSSETK